MGLIIKLIILLLMLWILLPMLGWGDEVKNIVLAPARIAQGVSAGVELHNIQYSLVLYRKSNDGLLPEEQFEPFIRKNFQSRFKDSSNDPWGQPYRYAWIPGGFALGSSGPDKKFQTPDDLILNWHDREIQRPN